MGGMQRNRFFSPLTWPVFSFLVVIAVGAVLLHMPASLQEGQSLSPIDAAFIATSAVCVTGLTPVDISAVLSPAGVMVLLFLVQLGGLGVMTYTSIIFLLGRNHVPFPSREAVSQALLGDDFNLKGFLLQVLALVFSIELVTGLLLYWHDPVFFHPISAAFHAVSAFCNAGFSLSPNSLMNFRDDVTVNCIITASVFLGSIGFGVLREALGITSADTLMTDMLWSLPSLTLPDTVRDLSDLAYMTGLRSLTIQNVSGLDFSVLSQLTELTELDLSGCTISTGSLNAIASLTNLTRLRLNQCALTDISAFSPLTNLTELQLSDNSITEVGVLSLMLDLETVTLSNNPVTSIAGLSACGKLKSVDISGCSVTTIAALADKTQLESLLAGNNKISDLSPLAGCSALSVLEVPYNSVEDISVLSELPALTRFVGNNNAITAVPDFDEDNSKLQYFQVDNNAITDIDSLNYVYADYNQVETILPLENCINLIQINVWDNPIPKEEVDKLQEHSIIVNYNPNYEPPEEETEE